MIKKKNSKVFIALVLVVAVIAVLAAILIPTYSKSQDSKAMQKAENAYTEYVEELTDESKIPEYMVYELNGRFIALRNGSAVGVYDSREDAVKAMIDDPDMSKLISTDYSNMLAYDTTPAPDENDGDPDAEKNPVPDVPTDWSGVSAVFLGDSITDASKHTSKFYYEHLKESLNLGSVKKQATSGSCISVKSDYGTNHSPLTGRYKNIPEGELIVIFMGTNDYGHATPLGSIADTTDISFYGALNTVISGIQADHPDSQIVMVTPLHRTTTKSSGMTSSKDSDANKVGATLEDYVNAIKDICKKYDLYTIDLFSEPELDPNNETVRTTCFNADGLHPNTAGHKKIAEIISEKLLKIPRKNSSVVAP